MFHQHRTRLLNADRDDLAEIVKDIVSGMEDVAADLAALRVRPVQEQTIGIPGSSSKLALNIGPPTSFTPWAAGSVHTIRVVAVDKPKKGVSSIYPNSPSSSVFGCPSARSHPGAYTHALDDLVKHIEDILDREQRIELRPGSAAQLKAATLGSEISVHDQPLDVAEAVEARRMILPLALVLLLSIPDLSGAYRAKAMDKGVIADMLHQLVALWPDGNPPRAALRRVNEYLMSKGE
jgi:tRNA A64-2'-O-ribosylphosphate transferase